MYTFRLGQLIKKKTFFFINRAFEEIAFSCQTQRKWCKVHAYPDYFRKQDILKNRWKGTWEELALYCKILNNSCK